MGNSLGLFSDSSVGPSVQNGHLWPFWGLKKAIMAKSVPLVLNMLVFILVSIPRFWDMGNSLGLFSDTSDLPEWPKRPFVAILG